MEPPEQALHLAVFDLKDEMDKKLYSDQTGRFPVTSYRGNQYVMIAYHCDSNAILVCLFKMRKGAHQLAAFDSIMERLWAKWHNVHLQILDNL